MPPVVLPSFIFSSKVIIFDMYEINVAEPTELNWVGSEEGQN